MKHGSLFSGIGGFDLASEWMGWENVFHCEWNGFGQRVLKYYWPNAESFRDITKTDFTKYADKIDILTGGFPCQPYSQAGKRLGKEDDRHLWPEMLRAIQEIRPRWVVGENVLGIVNWNGGLVFDEVQSDLEAEGYEVQSYVLPAAGVGAPHRRDRIWFVAYCSSKRLERASGKSLQEYKSRSSEFHKSITAYSNSNKRRERGMHKTKFKKTKRHFSSCDTWRDRDSWENFPTKPPICGGNDGIPRELDAITFPKWRNESIKAYGNAIVPQVAYQIFKSIEQYDNIRKNKSNQSRS